MKLDEEIYLHNITRNKLFSLQEENLKLRKELGDKKRQQFFVEHQIKYGI